MAEAGLDTKLCSGHGGWPPRANTSRSDNVIINGFKALRKDDTFASHCNGPSCHTGVVIGGSNTVYINNKKAARNGDAISCGSTVANGSTNVFIGD